MDRQIIQSDAAYNDRLQAIPLYYSCRQGLLVLYYPHVHTGTIHLCLLPIEEVSLDYP